jgi:hypothetical protein
MAASGPVRGVGWRKWAISASAAFLGLIQLKVYFVRELLVAELLLLIALAVVAALCGFCLLLGTIGERGGLLIREGSQAVLRASSAGRFDSVGPQEQHATIPSFSD